ncbi:MAG: FkbM family methyltransferase [Pseudomonadota bacterium]|nr:FkbM family methyltransferase [Pseudomonadota bacterium]
MTTLSPNHNQLLLILITSSGEPRELTSIRNEQLEKLAIKAKSHFSKIKIINTKIEELTQLDLPITGWVFYLMPGEIPLPNLVDMAAVGLQNYEAIWGGVLIQNEETNVLEHREGTMFGCTDLPKLIFRNPEKWLASSFFIRADKIHLAPENFFLKLNFQLEMWNNHRCIKLGVPFVIQNNGSDYENQWITILDYFRENLIVKRFKFDDQDLVFRIAYWNPFIESKLVSGQLSEDSQLLALKKIVKPGATIVDIGANIGQHTIFFAKNLMAKKVIPIEPNPDFSNVIKENMALNNTKNIDISFLNYCVGDVAEKCKITGSNSDPQNITLEYNTGEIPVFPLDDLIEDVVDLIKIDVDEHELKVLRGMTNILGTDRPILVIEVVHQNLVEFLNFMSQFDYKIDRIFSNPQYTDIIAIPR